VTEFQFSIAYDLVYALFVAIRTLQQLMDDERFPRGSCIFRRDVYVDIILSGAVTRRKILELLLQLRALHD